MILVLVDQKRNGNNTEQQAKKTLDIQGEVIWNITLQDYGTCNSICGKSKDIQSSPLVIPNVTIQ